jgi:hypothetical protein
VHAERRIGEGLVPHDGPMERQRGRHALHQHLVECAPGALDRLPPVLAGDDHFRQQ